MLIKAMRDDKEYSGAGHLQNIVHSLLDCKESDKELSGVNIGFFSTLCHWIHCSAKNEGDQLDAITFDDLIKNVVIGLKKVE